MIRSLVILESHDRKENRYIQGRKDELVSELYQREEQTKVQSHGGILYTTRRISFCSSQHVHKERYAKSCVTLILGIYSIAAKAAKMGHMNQQDSTNHLMGLNS